MNRRIAAVLLGVMLIAQLIITGCSAQSNAISEDKMNVYTSFYPLYDFAARIGGEHVQVTSLVPAGVDPHDWSPKSQDIIQLSKAQLFIHNGAGFDDWWVEDLLASLGESKPKVVTASEGIELIPADGEGAGHDHGSEEDEHLHGNELNEHDHGDYDPHVWLSPLNAMRMAENILGGLIAVDPEHEADYRANFEQFSEELKALHEEYMAVVEQAGRREFVTSHQAFAYLARDYGLTQLSIMGLSTEAEPTSQDMMKIMALIREHGVRYILYEELSSPKIAKTLAEDLGIEMLPLNPIEGLTPEQEAAGENYVSLMRHNLRSLELALQE